MLTCALRIRSTFSHRPDWQQHDVLLSFPANFLNLARGFIPAMINGISSPLKTFVIRIGGSKFILRHFDISMVKGIIAFAGLYRNIVIGMKTGQMVNGYAGKMLREDNPYRVEIPQASGWHAGEPSGIAGVWHLPRRNIACSAGWHQL